MSDDHIPIDEKEWAHCPACVRAPVVQAVTVDVAWGKGPQKHRVYIASCWGDTTKGGPEQFPSHSYVVRGLSLEDVMQLWNNR